VARHQYQRNGVYRVVKRHRLKTSAKRLALIAARRLRPDREERASPKTSVTSTRKCPGQLVHSDCFYLGRLAGRRVAVDGDRRRVVVHLS
jgi:hypothetical protein